MALTLRNTKGSELTFSELDGNFTHLDNKIDSDLNVLETNLDSDIAALQSDRDSNFTHFTDITDSNFTHFTDITDSIGSAAHIQSQQIKYNTADFLDSETVELVVDSAYVQSRVDFETVIDSAYVQLRQADIYRDSAFITGIIDSDYITTRQNLRDSAFVTGLIDSAYIDARTPDAGVDSAAVIDIVDSDYLGTKVKQVLLQPFTVATAPSGTEGQLIYVTDGDDGSPCLAIYQGGEFKVVSTLGSAIGSGGGGGGF